jgi:hypothetical protein
LEGKLEISSSRGVKIREITAIMKTRHKLLMGIVAAGTLSLCAPALAVISFNEDITAIFGGGNGDGSWTVDQANGVELGLRAKQRFPAANIFGSNGDGTYNQLAGNNGAGRALWNFEWSINSGTGNALNSLTYLLKIDTDPSAGINYTTSFDPIHSANPNLSGFWDHSIGNSSTLNGAGSEANSIGSYASLIADNNNNIAQNSWYIGWYAAPFNPNILGSYSFRLEAYDGINLLAATEITVNAVPEPSTYLAGALLLLPFGVNTLRKFRNNRQS